MLKYKLFAIFPSKGITTFAPPWYSLIPQCTVANKKTSIPRRNGVKNLAVAGLNASPTLQATL